MCSRRGDSRNISGCFGSSKKFDHNKVGGKNKGGKIGADDLNARNGFF
jgi:hypothetical protein